MTIVSKIEQLEICLRGFVNSNPEDKKGVEFKERMIREISDQLRTLTGEKIELKTDNE